MKLSEVIYIESLVEKSTTHISVPYTEGNRLYCDYFFWVYLALCLFFNCFVMCVCVFVCVCVCVCVCVGFGFVMCGCFGNMCNCIYYVFVFYCLCIFIVFMLLFNFVSYVILL